MTGSQTSATPPTQAGRGDDELILEGIVTTISPDGSTNISPMGPVVDRGLTNLRLRPFQTSRTYLNLKRTGHGVFHITDDIELLVRAATGQLTEPPELRSCPRGEGNYLAGACRWYAFEVTSLDDRSERTDIQCGIVEVGRIRDFLGWNRAQSAIVEAAILATRIHILDADDIIRQLDEFAVIVEKTAGSAERRAFELVRSYVQVSRAEMGRAST